MRQDILEKQPNAKLKVYVIWINRLFSDSRSRWPRNLFNDPRVVEFWDENQISGLYYGKILPGRAGQVMWDIYALYGPDAVWKSQPSHLISWFRTLYAGFDQLEVDIERLLKQ